ESDGALFLRDKLGRVFVEITQQLFTLSRAAGTQVDLRQRELADRRIILISRIRDALEVFFGVGDLALVHRERAHVRGRDDGLIRSGVLIDYRRERLDRGGVFQRVGGVEQLARRRIGRDRRLHNIHGSGEFFLPRGVLAVAVIPDTGHYQHRGDGDGA